MLKGVKAYSIQNTIKVYLTTTYINILNRLWVNP